MKKLIFALIAGATVAGAAQAQNLAGSMKPYVGGALATADRSYEFTGASNINDDEYKTSGKIFGGVEIDQMYGVEVGYTDFRASDFTAVQNGAPLLGDSEGYGTYIAGKASMPLNDRLVGYGKLGISHSKRELSTSNGLHLKDYDTGIYAGVGVQYNVSENVALLAEYERYGKSKDFGAKADVWTVGAKYSF